MMGLFLLLFPIIYCENLIKNPSFEEVDEGNNKPLYWEVVKGSDLSSDCHSGSKSLHWRPNNSVLINKQIIYMDKNFKYEICLYYKLKNIYGKGLHFYIEAVYKPGQNSEAHYIGHTYNGTNDWKQACYTMQMKNQTGKDDLIEVKFGVYTHEQKEENGEVFIDDITIYRIHDMFKIAINNYKDEVYDVINVVYQTNTTKENYTLNDLKILTKIKNDKNEILFEKENNKIISSLFTEPINIENLRLEENKFYTVEGTLISTKDDIVETSYYTFKKIKKINREISFDKYGRMFINNTLFFPFGIFMMETFQGYLKIVNQTHFNLVLPYWNLNRKDLDYVYTTQNGKIKVIYNVKDIADFDFDKCIASNEEENYIKFKDTINELKGSPALIGWYINDEIPHCFNKYLRNRTLTIHELDPEHPTLSVLYHRSDFYNLMNSSDIMGFDQYVIDNQVNQPIRNVYDRAILKYNNMLEAKPFWSVIQIFDQAYEEWKEWGKNNTEYESNPPTLQEMKSMSWQGFAAGAKGIIFYSFFSLWALKNKTNITFEERWEDVIEFTDEIWKYKDVILSIEEIDEIKYENNTNVAFKQWKYNDSNYIVIVNLERTNQIFTINNCELVNKEFGLGTIKNIGNNLIFYLEPIDVIMIKYKIKNDIKENEDNNLIIIVPIIIIAVLALVIIGLLIKRYMTKKSKLQDSKLIQEINNEKLLM